jgi:hypothetical protein
MQQRQLRLGDILDDYCPRERRLTNHAVVAMVGADVIRTRCTTCDAEHEYKHAKVPHQRRKPEAPAALYAQVANGGPKKSVPDVRGSGGTEAAALPAEPEPMPIQAVELPVDEPVPEHLDDTKDETTALDDEIEGPVHRRLIRATLPRTENAPPPSRPIPEFTIRQPGGRPNRFRPRQTRGGQPFQGNRSNGSMAGRGGRPPGRQRHGHKRSK